ncbi:DUF4159 domain-containing protein [Natronogracilivirga saccharolytica]|uniref:DUF4159 domain-containing protein n=1 Tax=Natronogracilivirga saccharolytica TaxID=2812953 RepID=A0A8J7S8A4_9BACT|nr:DUF4159 domain-containing protein [Natronogracilivirga saccharolytica]MBP3193798.1 DUF4159 domain-containing protein [Natronogracilivirga saccharolytica]
MVLRISFLVALLWTLPLLAPPAHANASGSSADNEPEPEVVRDEDKIRIARLQYRGGGDWYSSPTALPNMIRFAREQVPLPLYAEEDDISLGSRDIFNYPMLFMTGHGHIDVNSSEMDNLRQYLENGGFLYVDDDYGFDEFVRPILKDIFPDEEFFELPADHMIYRNVFEFPEGRPPKVHEHDGKPPQAFAVYRNGRMVLLYTYESNPADGWAYDQHDNPEEIVQSALRFGVNMLVYVFTQSS